MESLEKLLVVDDWESNRDRFKDILKDLVDAPECPQDLERALRENKYPMIFVDGELWREGICRGEQLIEKIKSGAYGPLNQNAIMVSITLSGRVEGTVDSACKTKYEHLRSSLEYLFKKYLPEGYLNLIK